MRAKKSSISFVSFFALILFNCTYTVESSLHKDGPVISRLANYLVKYFNLDKLEHVNHVIEHSQNLHLNTYTHEQCDSIEEMENYFFKVYSDNQTITYDDFDDIIHYHVLRTRKQKNEARHRKNVCNRQNCFHSKEIFKIANTTRITKENFKDACIALLYNIELDGCSIVKFGSNLSRTLVWVIGLSFATVVTLWSWIGGLALPFIRKSVYKKILAGMIALACGCVLSNSLLKFVPMAVGNELVNLENPDQSYFLKHLIFIAMIFFFFNFERCMKLYAFYKKEQRDKEKLKFQDQRRSSSTSLSKKEPVSESNGEGNGKSMKMTSLSQNQNNKPKPRLKKSPSIDLGEVHIMGVSGLDEITDKFNTQNSFSDSDSLQRQNSTASASDLVMDLAEDKPQKICCTSLTKGLKNVRPIGWMAIFGDGLSNFIDGLSIGAAMNQGITAGLTVALACWFGNIPQELGDFALLVRAGMSPFQALFYNYASSLSCYIGFTVGCIAGQAINVARWIFAVSGGTTMYIGLAVLLPEIVEEFEEIEPFKEKVKLTFIQLAGLVLGFTIMILLNMYEEEIHI